MDWNRKSRRFGALWTVAAAVCITACRQGGDTQDAGSTTGNAANVAETTSTTTGKQAKGSEFHSRPVTTALFDASTTVSEMENVLAEERALTELVPLAKQVQANVSSYFESLPDDQKTTASALAEGVRQQTDLIISNADKSETSTLLNAVSKLRDEYMLPLRDLDRAAKGNSK